MNTSKFFRSALDQGRGVLRLAPNWVPRAHMRAGGRLRLHPNDLFAFGPHRGAFDERWLASNVKANNGPDTRPDEGLSYVEFGGELAPLAAVTGDSWQVLCKLFDNAVPIPFHLHRQKYEAYFYPAQYNHSPGAFPYTFFGLEPHTSREDIRRCLARWSEGDNGILYHSKAYKLKPGTGWQVDVGVLHAPGTMVTYEPQAPFDAGSAFESICAGDPLPWDYLTKELPEAQRNDIDAILDLVDWGLNTDPFFADTNFRAPRMARSGDTYLEKWIVYGSPHFSARELTIGPGMSTTLQDAAAYGALVVEGHGTINGLPAETPTLLRFGQMSADEFFVTAAAAADGVTITNTSAIEPLVILKHFGPRHPEAAEFLPS
ncbi:MAG: hypothetical protein FJW38_00505 [Acidobacteria bacterium]|nr:hypothetical protein [Acidobacteriota bacterium]